MSNYKEFDFNLQLVKDNIETWTQAATVYHREAEKSYAKIRSYLTLYQFRLSDQQKCDIREMLSQHLDDIDKNDLIQDMDNYLDGFCFKLDKSVLPNLKTIPKSVKIEIAQPANSIQSTLIQPNPSSSNQINHHQTTAPLVQPMGTLPNIDYEIFENIAPLNETTVKDFTDIYAMQFYQ